MLNRITNVLGFNVPQLVNFDDELRILEMTIVERPFVLDFAAAYLDVRPEFSDEIWSAWEAEKREQFEARWPKVTEILVAFEAMGDLSARCLPRKHRFRLVNSPLFSRPHRFSLISDSFYGPGQRPRKGFIRNGAQIAS